MRYAHGCHGVSTLVVGQNRSICSATQVILRCTKPEAQMVENRMEYYAVSTGVVLTAIVALIPFIS